MKAALNEIDPETISKINKRWTRVLELIKLDNGGNRYVEKLRGKLTNDPWASPEDEDAVFTTAVARIRKQQKEEQDED